MALEDSFMAARPGKGLIRNRKGSIQDLAIFMVVLLFFGMVLLIGYKVTSSLNDQFQASSIIPAEGKAASATLTGFFPGVLDNSFLLLTIGMCIVTLVLASLVRIHPIFIPFYFIGWVLVIFFSGILSNIYQTMAADTNLIAITNQLTFIEGILTALPIIVGIFGTLLLVVMYKLRGNQLG